MSQSMTVGRLKELLSFYSDDTQIVIGCLDSNDGIEKFQIDEFGRIDCGDENVMIEIIKV